MFFSRVYYLKITLFFVYLALILFRLPQVFLQGGRFIFEDGTIFFAYAWHFSDFQALFHSFGGYLNLIANVFTLLAARMVQNNILPLRFAPAVPCFFAFLFQLIPAVLILSGRIRWMRTPLVVGGALLSVACAAMSEESWLNILHVQLWLTLSCGLLLLSSLPKRWYTWLWDGAILVLAPLCGMTSLLLVPLFFLKSIQERSFGRFWQGGLLGCAGFVQLLFFYHASPIRHPIHNVPLVVNLVFVRMELVSFFGYLARYIADGMIAAYQLMQAGVVFEWYGITSIALVAVGVLIILCWFFRGRDAGWLFFTGLVISFVSVAGGMALTNSIDNLLQPKCGEHYNFLPGVFLVLGLLALSQEGSTLRIRRWAGWFYLWTLLVAMSSYAFHPHLYGKGNSWASEVAVWEKAPAYYPKTWIGSSVDVSSVNTPCSQSSGKPFASIPTYCEASWEAIMEAPDFEWPK